MLLTFQVSAFFQSSGPPVIATSSTNSCIGEIYINVTSGLPPYAYQWEDSDGNILPGADSFYVNNLPPDFYTVTVTDQNDSSVSQTYQITEAPDLTGIVEVNDVTCLNAQDGQVIVSVSGNPSFNWTLVRNNIWSSSITGIVNFPNNVITINGLDIGEYDLFVTDIFGCTGVFNFEINQPFTMLGASLDSSIDASCPDSSDGSLTVTASGGWGGYTYNWFNASGDSIGNGNSVSGLAPGTYTVNIRDSGGCEINPGYTVGAPDPITVSEVLTPVSCNGGADGAINLTIQGGTGSHNVSWDNGASTEDISGLSAGEYTVTILDENSCTYTETFIITAPDPLVINESIVQVSCFGGLNGAIYSNVSGGTAPYNYQWSDGSNAENLENIPAGSYSLMVTDANSCVISETFVLTEPPVLVENQVINQSPSCPGGNDGSLEVIMQGGAAPYTYEWFDGSNSNSISGLSAGTYALTVTDANDCRFDGSYTIIDPLGISISTDFSAPACPGSSDGAITVTPSNGLAPYSYNWGSFGSTDSTLNGVPAGAYTVTVTDANGCSITEQVTLNDPPAIQANPTVNHISCYGEADGSIHLAPSGGTAPYAFVWAASEDVSNSRTNLGEGSYTVTIIDGNGCSVIETYTIDSPEALTVSASTTDVLCYGDSTGAVNLTVSGGALPYTYLWSNGDTTQDLSSLPAGSYSVTVTDGNGCTTPLTVDINEPSSGLSYQLDSLANISCHGANDGAIEITVSGGTGSYQYLWNDGANTEDRSGLSVGDYSLQVTDSAGCVLSTETFTITEPTLLEVDTVVNHISCSGADDGSITLTVSGGTAPYRYEWADMYADTSARSGLSPGSYEVTVSDANGCSQAFNFTIDSPEALTVSASTTDVLCYGDSSGAVDLTVSGGTLPYTYLWSNGDTTQDLSSLPAGSYMVTVTDANGCTAPLTVDINEPSSGLSYQLDSLADISCHGANDGAIEITVSGGTGSYQYLWNDGANTEDRSDLSAGDYSLQITDSAGCVLSTETFTITEPTLLEVDTVVNHISCSGADDGSITLTVSGGTAPYRYEWADMYADTSARSGLSPGSYEVVVSDANGCSQAFNFTISSPEALTVSASTTNVLCYGDSSGAVDLTVSGGALPYTYLWSNGDTTQDLSSLPAGSYSVTVTDGNGCTTPLTVDIDGPSSGLSYQLDSLADISCHGANDGAIEITVSGGTGSYQYLWNDGANTEDRSGLLAGDYSLQITDSAGCVLSTETFTITEPTLLEVDTVVNHISCSGTDDGSIALTVSGGTAPYRYEWADMYADTSARSDLSPGSYEVVVSDANGCSQTLQFTIESPTALTVVFTKEDVLCYGDSSGAVDLTVSGGTLPYTYLWSNGDTTQDLSSLPAGSYMVTVTDANGCTTPLTVDINGPSSGLNYQLDSLANISCHGANDGAIEITVSGGTGSYQYLWNDGANTQDRSGLLAGDYSLQITDSAGCVLSTETFTIIEPTLLEVDTVVNHISCSGTDDGSIALTVSGGTAPYRYEWADMYADTSARSGLSPGSYEVVVSDANGCSQTLQFTIESPTALTVVFTKEDVLCYGDSSGAVDLTVSGGALPYTYLWSNGDTTQDLSSLPAGSYTVTVTDANGCMAFTEITIEEPALPLSVSGTVSDESCAGMADGAIDLAISGGTAPYTYEWSNGSETGDIEGLLPGFYQVIVTDDNGCTIRETFRVEGNAPLQLEGLRTHISCNEASDGAVDLTVSGGVAPYTYLWSNEDTAEDISGLPAGDYSVEVTDANGCSATAIFTLIEPLPLVINYLVTNVSCFGETDGSIDVAVSGGTAPYTYRWSNDVNEEDLSLLDAGTYTLLVTDSMGCHVSSEIIVEAPSFALTATAVVQPALCNGLPSGGIDITPTGGTAPYTYLWSNGSTQSDLENVFAGTYAVTVTDRRGCTFSAVYEIEQGTSLTASLQVVDPSCAGDNDGSIIVNPDGGQAPYEYLWSSGSVSKDLIDVPAGDYSVTITDANGCSRVESATLENRGRLDVEIEKVNLVCRGASTGVIDLTPIGGSPPYVYDWSNGANTEDLTNIPAGVYGVTVTDANGCSFEESIIISEPSRVLSFDVFQSQDMKCFGERTGFASVNNIRGGAGPYDIRWSTGANTREITGLPAGDYTVLVTDANGCSMTETVTIAQPEAPIAAGFSGKLALDCTGASDGYIQLTPAYGQAPYTYLWSNGATSDRIENLSAGAYSVRIIDANGCTGEETVRITEPMPLSLESSVTDALDCDNAGSGAIGLSVMGGVPPYQYAWSNGSSDSLLTNVPSGIYSVTVTDANGCSTTGSYTINRPEPLAVSLRSDMEVDCDNQRAYQRVSATAYGGSGVYTYRWSRGNTTTNEEVLVYQGGLLTITITDQQLGCERTETINIPRLPVIGDADFTYYSEEAMNNLGEFAIDLPITFEDRSRGDIIDWEWDFGDGFGSDEINPVHTYAVPGTYTIQLTTTNVAGCKAVTQQEIEVVQGYRVMLPNAFTPNLDGNNDFFRPSMKGLEEAELFIFNTWGEVIFHGKDLNAKGWDGTIKGKPAENGNYLFKVIGKTLSGKKIERHGVFALMR